MASRVVAAEAFTAAKVVRRVALPALAAVLLAGAADRVVIEIAVDRITGLNV